MSSQEKPHHVSRPRRPQPASYPDTDAAEVDAITLFRTVLDSKRVKLDLKERDKQPNTDGYLELVDDKRLPIGKLEVQVRKIPDGTTRYACPTSLFAYTNVTPLPVLLVCVDTGTRTVFWRHIRYEDILGKETQKSVTLKFNRPQDAIESGGSFLRRWESIASDYCSRIHKHELLQKIASLGVPLTDKPDTVVRKLQTFIDELNGLLDGPFRVLKRAHFPNVWKIGIGLQHWDESQVRYVLLAIEEGSTAPLIQKVEADAGFFQDIHASFYASVGVNHIAHSPRVAARQFIHEKLQTMISKNQFSLRCDYLSQEYLFSFIDGHRTMLGLEQEDSYSPEQLHHAFYEYLPRWCDTALRRVRRYPKHIPYFDPDLARFMLGTSIQDEVNQQVAARAPHLSFPLGSNSFSMKQIYDLVDYRLEQASPIDRVYRPPSLDGQRQKIWDGFTEDELRHNVALILRSFIPVYREFLRLNGMPDGPLLNLAGVSRIVHCYRSGDSASQIDPMIDSYYLAPEGSFSGDPDVTVSFDERLQTTAESNGREVVRVDGESYRVLRSASGGASWTFQRHPMLTRVLETLEDALEAYWGDPEHD